MRPNHCTNMSLKLNKSKPKDTNILVQPITEHGLLVQSKGSDCMLRNIVQS